MCRLKKTLYGLKQAHWVWYSILYKHLQQQGFKRGASDSNLYIISENDYILVIFVYVNDIIFGSDVDLLSQKFSADM